MHSHYVLKRWFAEPVDVMAILTDEFDQVMQVRRTHDEDTSTEFNDVAVYHDAIPGILIFHNSWGDSLCETVKVKVYLVNFEYVEDGNYHYADKIGDELNEWLTEKTGVGFPDEA